MNKTIKFNRFLLQSAFVSRPKSCYRHFIVSEEFQPELTVQKDTYTIQAYGRRLTIGDVSLAFCRSQPNSNRMRRQWVSVKDYKHRAFSDGGFVFDDDGDLPKVSVRAQADKSEFVSLQIKIFPKKTVAPLFFEGSRIELDYFGQEKFENTQSHFSYFSFAFNGVMKERASRVKWVDGAPPVSPLHKVFYREQKGVAWWLTALKAKGAAAALFLGAESAHTLKTFFSIHNAKDKHRVYIYQGLQGEYLPLSEKPLALDPVAISLSESILKTMHVYGARVAKKHDPIPSVPQKGWSSWYKYYNRISEKIILRETEEAKKKILPQGFNLLQIDDGYQSANGDWQFMKPGFKFGLKSVSKKISAQGMKPGIWLAPFLVDVKSKMASVAGKDWFLQDYGGRRLTYAIPKHSKNYILDVTHPEAFEWLKKQIQYLGSSGFRYLKIDFLFLAACEAKRFQPDVSGLEAYRLGLKLIRDVAGEETTLLLSGSLDLAGIGLGNANRLGPDIAYDVWGGTTRLSYIKAELMATASHFFMNHRWFTPNTDALTIRPPLKEALVEVLLAQAAMTGGDMILSDDFESLHKLRLRKLFQPQLHELARERGELFPLDYFDHVSSFKIMPNPLMMSWLYQTPQIWFWRDKRSGKRFLILYNLTTKPQTIERDLQALALETYGEKLVADGEWQDIFHNEWIEIANGRLKVEMPPETVRIFTKEKAASR